MIPTASSTTNEKNTTPSQNEEGDRGGDEGPDGVEVAVDSAG